MPKHEPYAGTYQSPWRFLVGSARSSLALGAQNTSKLLALNDKWLQKRTEPGEIYFLTNINYSSLLSGPLLSTVLLSAIALEALLRLAARSLFEKDIPPHQKAGGPSPRVLENVRRFDLMPSTSEELVSGKVAFLFQEVTGHPCPESLHNEIRDLFEFRNDSAHAEPILRTSDGMDQKVKRGSRRKIPYKRGARYPLLWASNRPLGLHDAIRAVRAHDEAVKGLLLDPERSWLRKDLDTGEHLPLIGSLPRISTDTLDRLALRWLEVDRAVHAISAEARSQFVDRLSRRRTQIRLVHTRHGNIE